MDPRQPKQVRGDSSKEPCLLNYLCFLLFSFPVMFFGERDGLRYHSGTYIAGD